MANKRNFRQKEPRKGESTKEKFGLQMQAARKWSYVELTFASAAWIVLVATVWAEPRPLGDYFIALAAGRDMIKSSFACLTQPDTWSFTTNGRIWLNQNWGTHLLYYFAYAMGGEFGSLALKALMLAATAMFIVMVCRQRGIDWPLAILTGGGAVAAGRSFIDLRPGLMTFMITPLMLWLLYRSRRKAHRVWAAFMVAAIWANVHGGFVFGLGVMVLWTLCWLVTVSLANGLKTVLRHYWPTLAATVAAVVASGTLTPFGIANLTHPLVVGQSPEWRTIAEWRPIYEGSWFGTTWEFYMVMVLLVVLPVLCSLVFLTGRSNEALRLRIEQLGLLIFSTCLCIIFFVLALDWQVRSGAIYDSLRQDRQIVLVVTGIVGLVGTLVVTVIFMGRAKGKHRVIRPEAEDLATLIFEVCLAPIVITMAVTARRFIPLAIIVLAPMVALQAQWLLRTSGKTWPVIPVAVALLVPALLPWQEFYKYYHPNNPMLPPHSIFQRMMAYGSYPCRAAEFLNANSLSGNVFNEWKWEGYLHWRCPQLKLFVGGRAQQVYSLETYQLRGGILTGADSAAELDKLGVHLVVVPDSFRYRPMIRGLVYGLHSRWAYVYYDGFTAVLADGDWGETKALIESVAWEKLNYPDPAIAAMSRARCLSSKVVGADEERVVMELMRANALKPMPKAYSVLKMMAQRGQVSSKVLIPYLNKQSLGLDKMPVKRAAGFDILACRLAVAETLSSLYVRVGDRRKAAAWAAIVARIGRQMATVEANWQGKYALICYPRPFVTRADSPAVGQ